MLLQMAYRIQPEVREYVLRSLLKDKKETSAIHLSLAAYYKSRAAETRSKATLVSKSSDAAEGDDLNLENLARQFYHLAQAGERDLARDVLQKVEITIKSSGTVSPAIQGRRYLLAGSALEQTQPLLIDNNLIRDSLLVSDITAEMYSRAGEYKRVGRVVDAQVKLLEQSSEYSKALKKQKQSLTIWRRLNNFRGVGASLIGLARLHQLLGQPKRSLKAADEAMEYIGPELDATAMALLFDQQGIALRELGRFDEALGKFDRSISIKQELKRSLSEASTWKEKGITLFALKRAEEAAECFNRALRAERLTDKSSKLAKELRAQGLELEVRRLYREALSKFSEAQKVALAAHSELCDQLESDVRRVRAKVESSEPVQV